MRFKAKLDKDLLGDVPAYDSEGWNWVVFEVSSKPLTFYGCIDLGLKIQ